MLRQIRIVPRFVGTVVGGGVIATVLVFSFIYASVLQLLDDAERRELASIFDNVQASIASQGSAAEAMATLVAGIPAVQKDIATGDRQHLADMFVPGFNTLKQDFGVRQFQFHLPPATSFLRVHQPGKFGDDLSSLRATVVETNTIHKPIHGLEIGKAGLGVRGIAPISADGKHVGSIEFGMSFGQSFFDDYTKAHNVMLALHLKRDGGMEPFASTLGKPSVLTEQQLQSVFSHGSTIIEDRINDTPVAVYADVIKDYAGKPIGVLQVAKDRTFYVQKIEFMRNVMLAMGIGGILIGGILIYFISRNVVNPLVRTTQYMREIAEGDGDLSKELPVDGQDEVAMLADGFNRFVRSVRELVVQVTGSVKSVGAAAEELATTAEHTSEAIRNQQLETTQIATAMTEMSSTVHEVAENTASTAHSAEDAEKQAERGQQVVAGAVASISDLVNEVQAASAIVQRVDKDSTRIGTVLDVIRGIAEQTNLLALNAAIEAARAGEQGRGFAVVADEVRSLARRTQESTEEIHEMIESLQGSVGETVRAMESSAGRAQASQEQANRVREVLQEITQSMDTISQMSTQIATAAEEQSHVAEEINKSVNNISQVAEQTAADAVKTSSSSASLAGHAEELVRLVGRFKT
ncbi:methyl-accepting chemotaxis protein [Gallaecimonas sp. GXIMD1310]|uniref:methyl-accepting chemotaxis protein n=1 Tax=Gallaecimonas sp. GXIMD1310 TaxID=3131926 RepID=UPI003245A733